MSDGYSDKSVSPIIYQPAADNDPQAGVETITDGVGKATLACSAIGTTIAPVVPLFFRRFEITVPSATPIQRASVISSTKALGIALQTTWLFDLITGESTQQTSLPSAQNQILDSAFIGGYFYVLAISGKAASIYRSNDAGITWETVCSYTAPAALGGDGGLSWNDTGSIIIANISVTSNNNFFMLRSIDSGVSFNPVITTIADVMSRNNSSAWLTGDIWVATCASAGTGKVYFLKSTDNGANWELKQTTTSTSLSTFSRVVGFSDTVAHGYGFRTSDAGETWVTAGLYRNTIKLGSLRGITFTSAGIFQTSDGLSTASKIQPDGSLNYNITIFASNGIIDGKMVMITVTTMDVGSLWVCDLFSEKFVTLPSLSVTSPAKLSAILTATAQLVTAGKSGTVKLYLQHTNEAITTASSLADVAGAWTDCGTLTHDTPLSLPSFTARAGEVIYPKIGFTCTDATGVSPAPELSSIAFAWSSDVTAPGEPTVTRIVNTSGSSSYGYRVDFGDLPATARHLIVEGSKNAAAYVPFNNKAQWAAGTHMKLRGSRDAVEEAGERNETSLSSRNGFVKNDTVQVKVAAEDDVGNRSAFVESDVITLADTLPTLFLSSSPLSIVPLGETLTLTWDSTEAVSITCDKDLGIPTLPLSGSATVSPTVATTYTFTATNASGATDVKTVSITIGPAASYVPVIVDGVSLVISERDEIRIEVE